MPHELADWAQWYASRGWAVFPVAAGGKTPLTPRGCLDASTEAATVAAWWTRWPSANIGIATGAPSGGLVVVDIDAGSGGYQSMDELAEVNGGIPATLRAETGGGGEHLFFRLPDGEAFAAFRNSASRIAPGIDTRGTGGYVVVPPSVHASGNSYRWVSDPQAAPVAELPAWLVPPQAAPQAAPAVTAAPRAAVGDVEARATAYVEAMPPSISGEGGHARAFAAARALVHGFRLPHDVARAIFQHSFNARCLPPWSDREVEHKLRQAATQPCNEPAGWLADQAAEGLADTSVGAACAAELLAGLATPPPAPVARVNAGGAERLDPSDLVPPGFVGELVQWITATAIKPQPKLALAHALCFAGTLMGRKVATETNARTNLYALGVAPSCSGKEHSRTCIKRLASAAGITEDMMGGDRVTSGAAIEASVYVRPVMLYNWDEIGHHFAAANARNAQGHQREIPVVLTELYTSSSGEYTGREYADPQNNPRRTISQPNVSLYGTTVPQTLYEALSPSQITDGFIGRLMLFESEEWNPPFQDVPIASVPEHLVQQTQAWWTRADMPRSEGNLAAVLDHNPIIVPMQDDARAVLIEARDAWERERIAMQADGSGIEALVGRAWEQAMKLSLIVSCGCEFYSPVITRSVALWAVRVTRHCVRSMVSKVRDNVASTDHERHCQQIMRVMRKFKALKRGDLTRKTQGMRPRDRAEAIAALLEAGRVVAEQEQEGRGPAAIVYRLNERDA